MPQVELPPEEERSPSPPPIYDRNGIRQNTREMRIRERQTNRRQDVIEELIKRDPRYRPPPDYRPSKKWKKIFIPEKQYPVSAVGCMTGSCAA
jgi:splicing factor 1